MLRLGAGKHRQRAEDALDFCAISRAGRMARQPAEVIRIALRELRDRLSGIVAEVNAPGIE